MTAEAKKSDKAAPAKGKPARADKPAKVKAATAKPAAKVAKVAKPKPAAKPASAPKQAKKPASKPQARTTEAARAVNMGPLRGDNSFPPSAKGTAKQGTHVAGPAADSTRGPGGKAGQAGNRGERGGGKGESA
jgi:hypothetical protein